MGYHQQAIAFLQAGRRREAGRAFFRAARLDLTDGVCRAWAGLALCAQLEGRDRLAQRADAKLATLTDRVERRRLIGELYAHSVTPPTGEPATPANGGSPLQAIVDLATVELQKNAEAHPQRADAHYHRAVCSAASGEVADAADQIKAALSINPHYDAAAAMAMRLGLVHADEDAYLADPYGA